jgi:hypothetical protein
MGDGDIRAALELINQRLDWIEENLGRVLGLQYVPMGRAEHGPDETPVPAEVVALARAGKTLDAINRYRDLTGVDFQHAQAAVGRL